MRHRLLGNSGLRVSELFPGAMEDLPSGGGADLVAESDEFAVHAPIPPGGIFGGQAHGQGTDAGGDGWSARLAARGGPAASDELAVPVQDRGRGGQESVTATNR